MTASNFLYIITEITSKLTSNWTFPDNIYKGHCEGDGGGGGTL